MIYLEIEDLDPNVLADTGIAPNNVMLRDSYTNRVVARGWLMADTPPGEWSAPEGTEVNLTLRFIGIGTGPAKVSDVG